MADNEKFKVTATWFNDAEVTLQVDRSVLTEELATEINTFWSGASDRLDAEDGDVVKVVIRHFGALAIAWMMEEGGYDCVVRPPYITQQVIDSQGEGWPDVDGLGILITDAYVQPVTFDEVELEAA
ncbi:DUF2528 family protein [Comamonadaceae bacterium PP-2]